MSRLLPGRSSSGPDARGTTRVPAALSRERAVTELVVPSPKQDEARALAERILVRTSDPDIARRVVALAGLVVSAAVCVVVMAFLMARRRPAGTAAIRS